MAGARILPHPSFLSGSAWLHRGQKKKKEREEEEEENEKEEKKMIMKKKRGLVAHEI